MMSASRFRTVRQLSQSLRASRRTFAVTAHQLDASKAVAAQPDTTSPIPKIDGQPPTEVAQAPNRTEVWSRNQKPRSQAMVGPRFEQTDFDLQPQPFAAIELIHKQPVRWTHDRIVSCDGGGGPAGHPRIFINTDKPEITTCNYCGLPFANEHHRKHLESLPQTSYPLTDVEGAGAKPPLSRSEPPL